MKQNNSTKVDGINTPEKINILIADDSAANVMVLESSLEDEESNIFTTTSPKNVIKLCIENEISIAIIDIRMPEIDGFELLDLIKKNPLTEHILVVLMTGYSMSPEHVVKGLNKGAVDYLFKPLDLYITIAKIKNLMTLVSYQKEIQKKNTELQNSKEELLKSIEQTERSKNIKENFLANMSHEIRTPLNAIIGLTHLLKASPINADQRKMIKLMGFSSNALLGIVNDILESAKIDAGKIEINRTSTDIKRLLKTICELTNQMAHEKGLELICEIDPATPKCILADSLRINQILLNLINNAIKFTPTGTIKIILKTVEQKDQEVLLEFVVEDSGVGIPKESIERIFTRFEQVDDKTWQTFGGTGLGLSIVKRLIKLKGGSLNVESEIGQGTKFTFSNWYKVVDELAIPEVVKRESTDNNKYEDILILLVEDNAVNQFIVVEMLREWNIKVDVASNGLEAFEMLKTVDYQLILMDTHMPVMNGNEATKKIRTEMDASKRDIPIISFSASVIEKEKDEAKIAGVDDFINKPFEPSLLVKKIQKLTRDNKK